MSIPAGVYKGRAVKGSEQFGTTTTKKAVEQIAIDLDLGEHGTVTTFLYFSDAAKAFSVDRLKALGWGGGESFDGLGSTEVDVKITYEAWEGKERMRVEVMTTGTVKLQNAMSSAQRGAFLGRLAKTSGIAPSGTAANGGKVPF